MAHKALPQPSVLNYNILPTQLQQKKSFAVIFYYSILCGVGTQ